MLNLPPSKPDYQHNYTLVQLPKVAAQVAPKLQGVVLFIGEMGAGKTTVIKALCAVLGVKDEVSSPTFSLINAYETQAGVPIYHFDLYRLENELEALDIGVEEYLESGEMCFIEWPEKIINFLPEKVTLVLLAQQPDTRQITVYTAIDAHSLV